MRKDRGDTIIEVLFAMTVFSLIAVGGLSLMSQGVAIAQRSLEVSLVRMQIDSQADALRYLNRAYSVGYGSAGKASELWQTIVVDHAVTTAKDFNEVGDSDGCNIPTTASDDAFALDVTKLDTNPLVSISADDTPATYAKVLHDSTGASAKGLWIQAVRSPTRTGSDDDQVRPGFYDFHIRACWFSPGQSSPVTLGTIVRLYEPRG